MLLHAEGLFLEFTIEQMQREGDRFHFRISSLSADLKMSQQFDFR